MVREVTRCLGSFSSVFGYLSTSPRVIYNKLDSAVSRCVTARSYARFRQLSSYNNKNKKNQENRSTRPESDGGGSVVGGEKDFIDCGGRTSSRDFISPRVSSYNTWQSSLLYNSTLHYTATVKHIFYTTCSRRRRHCTLYTIRRLTIFI